MTIEKRFVRKRPNTKVAITAPGRERIDQSLGPARAPEEPVRSPSTSVPGRTWSTSRSSSTTTTRRSNSSSARSGSNSSRTRRRYQRRAPEALGGRAAARRADGILLARADGARQAAAVGQQFAGRVGLFLRVDDFEAAHARMLAAGVEFVSEPRAEPYGRVAVFRRHRRQPLGPARPPAQPRILAFCAANSSSVRMPWSRSSASCLSCSIGSGAGAAGAAVGGGSRTWAPALHGPPLRPDGGAWRRDTRLLTAVAVPATAAVRATPRSSPAWCLLAISGWLRSRRARR